MSVPAWHRWRGENGTGNNAAIRCPGGISAGINIGSESSSKNGNTEYRLHDDKWWIKYKARRTTGVWRKTYQKKDIKTADGPWFCTLAGDFKAERLLGTSILPQAAGDSSKGACILEWTPSFTTSLPFKIVTSIHNVIRHQIRGPLNSHAGLSIQTPGDSPDSGRLRAARSYRASDSCCIDSFRRCLWGKSSWHHQGKWDDWLETKAIDVVCSAETTDGDLKRSGPHRMPRGW